MNAQRQSYLYSVLFHLLVLFLITLVRFQPPELPIEEFIEIIFPEAVVEQLQQASGAASAEVSDDGDVDIATTEVVPTEVETPPQTTPVAPPPAPDIEAPVVTTPDPDYTIPTEFTGTRPNRPGTGATTLPTDLLAPQTPATLTQDTTPTQSTSTGTGVDTGQLFGETGNSVGNYEMTGDVINRIVLHREIPTFPEGVRQSGSVRLNFEVLPSGRVQNITIERSSNVPEFDTVSTNALRNWLFNEANRTHTGTITFNFRVSQ